MKLIYFLILLVLTTLQLPGFASAVGISPGDATYIYNPGQVVTNSVTVINRNLNDEPINITVKGNLSEYLKLETPDTIIIPARSGTTIHYTLTMPEDLDPGTHRIFVSFSEQPKGEGMIAVMITTVYGILIKVPFPGKYAEVLFKAPDYNLNDAQSIFPLEVTNLGTETVDISGVLRVFDKEGVEVDSVSTATKTLEPKEQKIIYVSWVPKDLPAGTYTVSAEMDYGGEKKAIYSQRIKLGDIYIDVTYLNYEDIVPGDIAKFDVGVRSFWNKDIDSVNAEVVVHDNWREYGRGKSESVLIKERESGEIAVFVEMAEDTPPGEYRTRVIVNYEGKETMKDFIIVVTGFDYMLVLLILIVVVIIVIGIVGYLALKK